MNMNLKNNIKSNIKKGNETSMLDNNIKDDVKDNTENKDQETGTKKFTIGKKKEDKSVRKSFPLYVDGAMQKDLDDICKKTKYSRNELILMMIQYCIDNLEITE
ncbi:MAG: CopG family transcriptional regulator [Clostridium sp.]|uniref:CopG family transcriptional regulator n=1 Tax=Clostridium sp. TaxID=1506 RepID=UPI0025BD964D|nr:CopG family transcriptional regulator [Clostridium sp.]MCE5219686.1 CopG family transcriptional regulator [Clostridium sp.]